MAIFVHRIMPVACLAWDLRWYLAIRMWPATLRTRSEYSDLCKRGVFADEEAEAEKDAKCHPIEFQRFDARHQVGEFVGNDDAIRAAMHKYWDKTQAIRLDHQLVI